MRLGGTARYYCEIHSEQEVLEVVSFIQGHDVRLKVIGTGSNLIWPDEGFDGLVVLNKIDGFKIEGSQITIGAGVDWDEAVAQSVEAGLSGIEFLSLIPGTAGATPIQNVGAYGREIKDVLVSVHAYDLTMESFIDIPNADCGFGYRRSRFNREDSGRFIITSITLKLTREAPKPPFYDSLQAYLEDHSITDYTPQIIRTAVIAVRTSKLPDPDHVANNGSFFANPIVDSEAFGDLKRRFPDIVGWPSGNEVKLSAAWLIEQAGFKDYHDDSTGMATWHKQPLVLVNEHAHFTADLETFKHRIMSAVQEKFGITLEQEPETVR